MNFKSAVILCAVYFFTSVWSAGLNRKQIEICIEVYKIPAAIPMTMLLDFGIVNPESVFKYDSNKWSYINVKNLLLVLAYNGIFDSFEEPMLTSFEVHYYVNKFIECSKDFRLPGCLGRDGIIGLYDRLNFDENQMIKAKTLIPYAGQDEGFSTQVEFLLIMLDMLPKGKGLSQTQIEKFIKLYKTKQTTNGSIKPSEIKKIFNEFDMTQNEPFRSNRPAAKELMELMMVTAVRSTEAHGIDEMVLNTSKVRSLIHKFTQSDTNHDGLLTGDETKQFMEEFFPNNPRVSTSDNFDGNPRKLPPIFLVLSEHEAEKLLDIFKFQKNKPKLPTNINFENAEINVAQYLLFYAYKQKVEES